jgi:hypothetical protein
LDDCSHFVWTFPLRLKSDTFSTLSNFFAHVHTQFGCTIKSMQCDNGHEFVNSASRASFLPTVSHYACLALTPPNKMAKPSASFAPSTTPLEPFYFRHPCPSSTGLMPWLPPPISSIASLLKPCI